MKGKDLSLFIDDLYHNPELEIKYGNMRYMINGYVENGMYILSVDTIEAESKTIFFTQNASRTECVATFEEAKIFSGKTIYEAESEITVFFG